jgi:acylphosphatase
MNRLSVSLSGVIQDVGYRYFIVRRARERNVTGWVKNRADGTVEIDAVGEKAKLEELLRFIRVGPPAAHVAGVEARWFTDAPQYKEFDVKF